MPRHARKISSSGFYHVMLRGNEKKDVFLDDRDRIYFLDTLQRMKEEDEYELYAYCLMSNHVHLLIQEKEDALRRTMKRIAVGYVYYFNHRHNRVGHLFQDRYRSETIDGEGHLLACVRYIHRNPLKAGLVEDDEIYRWSSHANYLGKKKRIMMDIDTDFILQMYSQDRTRAQALLQRYTCQENNDSFIDYVDEYSKQVLPKEEVSSVIQQILNSHEMTIDKLRSTDNRNHRNLVLKEIKEATGASVRELASILEISKDIISRAK